MTHLHFTNFLENWLSDSLKQNNQVNALIWWIWFSWRNQTTNSEFFFTKVRQIKALIRLFCWNCNSTKFQENLWNEGVSFVETLDQSTKGFFMFAMIYWWILPVNCNHVSFVYQYICKIRGTIYTKHFIVFFLFWFFHNSSQISRNNNKLQLLRGTIFIILFEKTSNTKKTNATNDFVF